MRLDRGIWLGCGAERMSKMWVWEKMLTLIKQKGCQNDESTAEGTSLC
ncbi:MAG: hypothetical protein ACT6FE_06235 [Methanosarcinaceae archaeon]